MRVLIQSSGRCAVAAAMIAVLSLPAVAQSQAELRRENQRLATHIRELETELAAARDRIAQLEEIIRRMQAGQPAAQPAAQPPATIVSPPDASPSGLLQELKTSYEIEVTTMEPDTAHRVMLQALGKWASRVNRERRSQVRWHVRLVDSSVTPRGAALKLQAVDPTGEISYGEPFDVLIPRALARRLGHRADRGELDGVLVARGTLNPVVTINPDRAVVGPFDRPPFIGPYAEYYFHVDLRSLAPKAEDEEANP